MAGIFGTPNSLPFNTNSSGMPVSSSLSDTQVPGLPAPTSAVATQTITKETGIFLKETELPDGTKIRETFTGTRTIEEKTLTLTADNATPQKLLAAFGLQLMSSTKPATMIKEDEGAIQATVTQARQSISQLVQHNNGETYLNLIRNLLTEPALQFRLARLLHTQWRQTYAALSALAGSLPASELADQMRLQINAFQTIARQQDANSFWQEHQNNPRGLLVLGQAQNAFSSYLATTGDIEQTIQFSKTAVFNLQKARQLLHPTAKAERQKLMSSALSRGRTTLSITAMQTINTELTRALIRSGKRDEIIDLLDESTGEYRNFPVFEIDGLGSLSVCLAKYYLARDLEKTLTYIDDHKKTKLNESHDIYDSYAGSVCFLAGELDRAANFYNSGLKKDNIIAKNGYANYFLAKTIQYNEAVKYFDLAQTQIQKLPARLRCLQLIHEQAPHFWMPYEGNMIAKLCALLARNAAKITQANINIANIEINGTVLNPSTDILEPIKEIIRKAHPIALKQLIAIKPDEKHTLCQLIVMSNYIGVMKALLDVMDPKDLLLANLIEIAQKQKFANLEQLLLTAAGKSTPTIQHTQTEQKDAAVEPAAITEITTAKNSEPAATKPETKTTAETNQPAEPTKSEEKEAKTETQETEKDKLRRKAKKKRQKDHRRLRKAAGNQPTTDTAATTNSANHSDAEENESPQTDTNGSQPPQANVSSDEKSNTPAPEAHEKKRPTSPSKTSANTESSSAATEAKPPEQILLAPTNLVNAPEPASKVIPAQIADVRDTQEPLEQTLDDIYDILLYVSNKWGIEHNKENLCSTYRYSSKRTESDVAKLKLFLKNDKTIAQHIINQDVKDNSSTLNGISERITWLYKNTLPEQEPALFDKIATHGISSAFIKLWAEEKTKQKAEKNQLEAKQASLLATKAASEQPQPAAEKPAAAAAAPAPAAQPRPTQLSETTAAVVAAQHANQILDEIFERKTTTSPLNDTERARLKKYYQDHPRWREKEFGKIPTEINKLFRRMTNLDPTNPLYKDSGLIEIISLLRSELHIATAIPTSVLTPARTGNPVTHMATPPIKPVVTPVSAAPATESKSKQADKATGINELIQQLHDIDDILLYFCKCLDISERDNPYSQSEYSQSRSEEDVERLQFDSQDGVNASITQLIRNGTLSDKKEDNNYQFYTIIDKVRLLHAKTSQEKVPTLFVEIAACGITSIFQTLWNQITDEQKSEKVKSESTQTPALTVKKPTGTSAPATLATQPRSTQLNGAEAQTTAAVLAAQHANQILDELFAGRTTTTILNDAEYECLKKYHQDHPKWFKKDLGAIPVQIIKLFNRMRNIDLAEMPFLCQDANLIEIINLLRAELPTATAAPTNISTPARTGNPATNVTTPPGFSAQRSQTKSQHIAPSQPASSSTATITNPAQQVIALPIAPLQQPRSFTSSSSSPTTAASQPALRILTQSSAHIAAAPTGSDRLPQLFPKPNLNTLSQAAQAAQAMKAAAENKKREKKYVEQQIATLQNNAQQMQTEIQTLENKSNEITQTVMQSLDPNTILSMVAAMGNTAPRP